MFKLPKQYFGDISADEMREVADVMVAAEKEFRVAQCESRNHREHHGDLWQCVECLRVFCWEEGADDGAAGLCDDCWSRLHSRKPGLALA